MHQHHFVPNEPRAAPNVQTTTQFVYVTAPPASSSTVPVPGANNAEPEVSHRAGPAVLGHTSSTRPLIPSPTYQVPVRHQQRPNTPSSKPVHRTKGSHRIAAHSHKKPATKNPSTMADHHDNHRGHQQSVSSPLNQVTSSSGPAPTTTGQLIAPADHHHKQAGLHKTSQEQGMSGGAKAGLAIGLLLAFALVGGLIFLVYRRKKNQNEAHQPLDDEKTDRNKSQGSLPSHVSVRRTVANAPRLSLRPVTQMFPIMSEKQDNTSASTLIANSVASARTKTPDSSRNTQADIELASNPFGDDAEAPNYGDHNTLTAPAAIVPKPLSIKSERTGSGLSDRSLPSDEQALPVSGASSGARRLSPSGPGPNNVHRVQLDFNPSMDDELGLRAGQLVRMLHEYDDGWALCIRLDRSQQGVVPRTCISKLPVKPRPQGPPAGVRGPPQGRPRGGSNAPVSRGSPNDLRQRPMAPPNGRVRSQSNAHHQSRAQSPGFVGGPSGMPQARARANSDALSARRITPPSASLSNSTATSPSQGNSIPSRKPVPGQAL